MNQSHLSAVTFRQVPLAQLGKIVTGKTPRTSKPENYDGETLFLTPSDDLSAKYVHNTLKTLSESGTRSVKSCLIPPRSIAVSCIGSNLGKVVITTKPTVTNQQINSIILNEQEFDLDYVYYALSVLGAKLNYLSKTSTAIPFVNKSSFAAYEIPVPSLEEQRRIASIFCSVDDKILLNRHICANLQKQTSLLYKHWFIDYEFPNAQREPYLRAGGKLKKTPLGRHPVGWRQVKLADLIDVTGGGTPSTKVSEYWGGSISFFTPKDASDSVYVTKTDKTITENGLAHCRSKLHPARTVFITARGTVGKVVLSGIPMALNQSCYALRGRTRYDNIYIYHVMKQLVIALQNKANGAIFDAITVRDLKEENVILPPDALIREFVTIARPLYDMLLNTELQTRSLREQLHALLLHLLPMERHY